MPPPPQSHVNSWRRAEENAASWMRWWGFADAALTGNGADGGVDIRATGALGQVKAEVTQTGLAAVQRLPGARSPSSTQSLFFFSSAGFTKAALTCADEWKIACFTYDLFGAMTPVNGAARRVLRQVEEREAAAQRAREEAAAAEARRAAEEKEAAARRRREAMLAAERRQAEQRASAKADEQTREGRPTRKAAHAEALRRADKLVEEALQGSWQPGTPRNSTRRITEPQRVRATRADAPGRPRRPATAVPKKPPALHGKRRWAWLRLCGALVCLALATFALVNSLNNADGSGWKGAVIFYPFAVLFFTRYRAAVDHNATLDT